MRDCGVGCVTGVGFTVSALVGSTFNLVLTYTFGIGVRGVVSGVGDGGIAGWFAVFGDVCTLGLGTVCGIR